MATVASEWRVPLCDADDNALSPLCDCLLESGEIQNEELAAILWEWCNTKTNVRTFYSAEDFKACTDKTEFDKKLFDWNLRYFPHVGEISLQDWNQCQLSGRIGDLYTSLRIRPTYFVKNPNLLSSNPIRSMTLINDRAERAELFDLFTNWRIEKLWYLDVAHYGWFGQRESNLVDVIRAMKPMKSLKHLVIRGVRNTNFQISGALIGGKKLSKGCEIMIGGKKYTA